MPTADIGIAKSFIEALTGAGETPLRFRLIHDKIRGQNLFVREFTDTIEKAWPLLLAVQSEGYAVFYVLNETRPKPMGYVTDADVTRVRAIPADFDNGIPTAWHSKPDIIVRTSAGKGQALWLTSVPLKNFKPICRRIIAYYHSDPAVCNLSRILRLPGTLHLKGEPQLVTWERP
jgi:hypothetical protein